jgi:hypothetical protein
LTPVTEEPAPPSTADIAFAVPSSAMEQNAVVA